MPDWSYQTIFRPFLSKLPARTARSLTLQAIGGLSRIPGGTLLIKTLGHMELDPKLQTNECGIDFVSPVGLSGYADPNAQAQKALAQFGFGFHEVGPVTVNPVETTRPIVSSDKHQSITYPLPCENSGLDLLLERMPAYRKTGRPIFFRLRSMPGSEPMDAVDEYIKLMQRLAPYASAFHLDLLYEDRSEEAVQWIIKEVERLLRGAEENVPALLTVPVNFPLQKLENVCKGLDPNSWSGFVVSEEMSSEEVRVGRHELEPCIERVQFLKDRIDSNQSIIAAAGIHEPADAVEAMNAGASLVMLISGLVFSGPGLPKRINEAVLFERIRREPAPKMPGFWRNWGWMCLLGLGMILGGILAWIVAATTVLLPYDERFLGITRDDIHHINHHLLHFMMHDRITLAGTMISIGVLYAGFAYFALRYGQHWARTALLASGITGFSSFFLFVGYGYFDPLHFSVALILLPMFLLSMRNHKDLPSREPVNLHNSRAWRLAQWGQLMFVALGGSLAVGGLVIAGVGVTNVFVPQDLDFLNTSREQLESVNDRLVPLIAHDRAGFGGALFSNAVALLAAALWGIQQGRKWLWIVFFLGAPPAFVAGLGVHASIGYSDFIHLLPAYVALALYIAGMILLYPYMMRPVESRRN